MRYRNRLNGLLDKLDGTLVNLERIVNRQEPIESYRINIGKAQALTEEIRSIVEAEPVAPNEINRV